MHGPTERMLARLRVLDQALQDYKVLKDRAFELNCYLSTLLSFV